MKTILMVASALIGFVIGYNISKFVDKMVMWKQKQKGKTYSICRVERSWDKWINGIVVSAGMALAFYYFDIYKAIFTSIMSVIAVFGTRLDERIRIIPNEMVLFVLVLGLIDQISTNGLKGIGSGLLALVITGVIFFLSALITKSLSGAIGVGAGDIKLAMVLSLMMGMENVFTFLMGIALFLLFYLLVGIFTGMLSFESPFPMCIQIVGGSIVALYKPIIVRILEVFAYL